MTMFTVSVREGAHEFDIENTSDTREIITKVTLHRSAEQGSLVPVCAKQIEEELNNRAKHIRYTFEVGQAGYSVSASLELSNNDRRTPAFMTRVVGSLMTAAIDAADNYDKAVEAKEE